MVTKKEVMQEPPKRRNVFLTTVLIIVGLLILSSFFVLFVGVAVLFEGEGSSFFEGNVAIIEVKGTITGDEDTSFFSSSASSTSITKLIEEAESNDAVKAIVIEINSPGGSPVGSSEIAYAVKNADKPTVAWVREYGASGGYWVASAADHVVVHPLSITGSIGVYGSYLEFSGLMEKYNVSYQRMVAGEHKDTGSPLRPLSGSEERMLQIKLDKMHAIFIAAVAENRNLSYGEVAKVADGMYLLGEEAVSAGLADELGGRDEVRKHLEGVLGENITFDYVREEHSFFDSLNSMVSSHGYAIGQGVSQGVMNQEYMVRI